MSNASMISRGEPLNTRYPSQEEMERMSRRRFQDPKPHKRGNWWELRIWRPRFVDGKLVRKRDYIKLAPVAEKERVVLRLAAAELNKLNLGLLGTAAIPFANYVDERYKPMNQKLKAKSTWERIEGVLKNYLLPTFGRQSLHELSFGLLQRYFTEMDAATLSYESRDKVRDVLSGILRFAVKDGFLPRNPMDDVSIPSDRRGKRTHKPHLTPQQFVLLIDGIQEPYATMVYVAIYTGLRVSELIGLRWEDIHANAITIDERCCRGDWDKPKSQCSNATIGVNRTVIERIHRLKLLTVEGRCGGKGAVRKYRVVKSDNPTDLVFQSLRTGVAMRDNNILSRHLKPAARLVGMPWVNWRCLRTSHATWLRMAGADLKDRQAQMRHAHPQTTADIYDQFIPENQRKAVDNLSTLTETVQ